MCYWLCSQLQISNAFFSSPLTTQTRGRCDWHGTIQSPSSTPSLRQTRIMLLNPGKTETQTRGVSQSSAYPVKSNAMDKFGIRGMTDAKLLLIVRYVFNRRRAGDQSFRHWTCRGYCDGIEPRFGPLFQSQAFASHASCQGRMNNNTRRHHGPSDHLRR